MGVKITYHGPSPRAMIRIERPGDGVKTALQLLKSQETIAALQAATPPAVAQALYNKVPPVGSTLLVYVGLRYVPPEPE